MTRKKLTPLERELVWRLGRGHCDLCEQAVSFEEMEVDHVRAVVDGGENVADNLRPTHKRCNLARREGKARGGRPAWIERPDDPRVLYNVLLYKSLHEWLKAQGGAVLLREMIDKAMQRDKRR